MLATIRASSNLKGKSTLNQGDSILVNMRTAVLICAYLNSALTLKAKKKMQETVEDVITRDSGECSKGYTHCINHPFQ